MTRLARGAKGGVASCEFGVASEGLSRRPARAREPQPVAVRAWRSRREDAPVVAWASCPCEWRGRLEANDFRAAKLPRMGWKPMPQRCRGSIDIHRLVGRHEGLGVSLPAGQ